jgi:rfaE bifunctional protein nucleotidyltransferase chain/domain
MNMQFSKILNINDLKRQVARWRLHSNKIVFTNGCFDMLHMGHLHTLQQAKALGDKLIVGVNADSSVKKLKGDKRPIQNQIDRTTLLAALSVVDAVVIFEAETPLELIEAIIPNVLVKGGDWATNQIVGAPLVLQNGGSVHSIPFLEGYSTTSLIEKITCS